MMLALVQAVPAVVQAAGGPSVGSLLQGLGRRLSGKKVMRFWSDNGGWWEADVHNYNASTGQHRLLASPVTPEHLTATQPCV